MTDKIVFALAVPHTPWRPERAASFQRLMDELGHRPKFFKVFDERAPNWEWSRRLWEWGEEMGAQGATHLLQLQDDVRPCPEFWPILRAMVEANPLHTFGLQSQHPGGRNLANIGRRWYRTRAWLVGCQYVMPIGPGGHGAGWGVSGLRNWLREHEEKLTPHQREHEDVLISTWLASAGRDVWHPIPAIADVDLTIGSTYDGVKGHIDDHRHPTVTWHGYNLEQLKTPEYWAVTGQEELLPGPHSGDCSFCGSPTKGLRSPKTGAALCRKCLAEMMGVILGRMPE